MTITLQHIKDKGYYSEGEGTDKLRAWKYIT